MEKNVKEKQTIIKLTDDFNKKYSTNMNKFFSNSDNYTYDFDLISSICDNAIVDNVEGRKMSEFFGQQKLIKKNF